MGGKKRKRKGGGRGRGGEEEKRIIKKKKRKERGRRCRAPFARVRTPVLTHRPARTQQDSSAATHTRVPRSGTSALRAAIDTTRRTAPCPLFPPPTPPAPGPAPPDPTYPSARQRCARPVAVLTIESRRIRLRCQRSRQKHLGSFFIRYLFFFLLNNVFLFLSLPWPRERSRRRARSGSARRRAIAFPFPQTDGGFGVSVRPPLPPSPLSLFFPFASLNQGAEMPSGDETRRKPIAGLRWGRSLLGVRPRPRSGR